MADELPTTPEQIEKAAVEFREKMQRLEAEVRKVIVGYERVIADTLVAFLAGGHVLLEGVPGLGKTLLVRTLAKCVRQEFNRIQFTPDLMPADITGTTIVMEDPHGGRRFEFQKGPIFGNIVLADEVNRATPKTQSALLEAMQEGSVTVAGVHYPLPQPFFVLATQNPIEMEGTYPLPEAQLDRFMFKLDVASPSEEALVSIFERTTGQEMPQVEEVITAEEVLSLRALAREVPMATPLMGYVAKLVRATHPATKESPDFVKAYLRFGASPRAGQSMILGAKIHALMAGRFNVAPEDIQAVAAESLRHRLILNFEGEAEGITQDAVVAELLETVKV